MVTEKSLIAKGTKSRIIGGSVKAGYAVEVATIVEPGKSVTRINVGDPAWIGRKVSDVSARLEKVEDEYTKLMEGKERIGGMFGEKGAESNALFHKICIAIRMKEEEAEKLKAEKAYYEKMAVRATKAYIKVFNSVQEGVTTMVCGRVRRIGKTMNGMMTFRRDGYK